jgi:hypothetical protein
MNAIFSDALCTVKKRSDDDIIFNLRSSAECVKHIFLVFNSESEDQKTCSVTAAGGKQTTFLSLCQ